MAVKIIAEVGICHNGDLNIAKKLIDIAVLWGCDAVKFQKRTVNAVYSQEFLSRPRESPWGTSERAVKEHLEFGKREYDEINEYCRGRIDWFASAWDIESLEFLDKYHLKYQKVASPMLTNIPLIGEIAQRDRYTFVSTGMSTVEDIQKAVEIFRCYHCPFELMHCVSVYNMPVELANLRIIPALKKIFGCDVGYSGHEQTLVLACAAVALGATSIEKHVTLDHAMYGSDHAASLEPHGLELLVKYVRAIEKSMGDGQKKILDEEKPNIKKLRYFEGVKS